MATLQAALDSVELHPAHILAPFVRRLIYQDVELLAREGAGVVRAQLGIATARRVLPIWRATFPDDAQTEALIDAAEEVLRGNRPADYLADRAGRKRPGVTEPPMPAILGSRRLGPPHNRRLPWQTRRALLTRLSQLGLVTAGLELIAACDRLPGQAPHVPRIGWVANLGPPGDPDIRAWTQALIAGLGDDGYVIGQNLQMDSRFPSEANQNAEMIGDLLRSGVGVLVTGGTAASVTAKQATTTVPIVGFFTDPVGQGLVRSLARPGGNVTGISLDGTEYVGKWLELLQKIKPTLRRVGWLYNPDNPGHIANLERATTLAATAGLEIVPGETRAMADLDNAVDKVVTSGAEALVTTFSTALGTTHVAALALSHKLISLGVNNSQAAEGLLLSYSPDYIAIYRRLAYYIDRILKGAKPADLPVELPTTFDLVVNHATASALGVTIPDEVALQVTSWI